MMSRAVWGSARQLGNLRASCQLSGALARARCGERCIASASHAPVRSDRCAAARVRSTPAHISGVSTRRHRSTVTASQPAASATSSATEAGVDYFADDKRPVILFDGVCNMCNAGVNFVLDWDPEGKVRMAALQSEAGRALLQRSGRSADDISSIGTPMALPSDGLW